jgi:putative redox protein
MASRIVRFSSRDGVEVVARLDLPFGEARACTLFAHCFTCSKDSRAATYISRALAARGIAVLRLDFSGLEFSSNVNDLVAGAEWLRAHAGAPQLLVGHSLGGTAALAAAGEIPEVRAVVTIGAPFEPKHVLQVAERTFRMDARFVADLERHDLAARIAALRRALLVLHAPNDTVVGIDNASRIFLAARHPKSFVSLDDADHLLTRAADGAYVAEVLAAWASRYLDAPQIAPVQGVRVAQAAEGRFAQDIQARKHRLRADEPESFGGDDTGPTPYDFLLAALGACTAMTLRLYAERKGLSLEHVAVDLRHERIHAADCADCETKEGRIDHIERTIALGGALDEASRARLLEIADMCPVHRTLQSEVRITTRSEQSGLTGSPRP